MRTKRVALLLACLLVAGMLLPGSALAAESSGVDVQGELQEARSCTARNAAIDRVIEDSIDLDLDTVSSVDAYRLRCEMTPVDDPRIGASYELSVFLGVACPSGAADEFCFFKSGPHVVDRVGAEVSNPAGLAEYTPGDTTISVPVCVQFVICESVEVPLSFTLELFDEGQQGEIEVFVIGDPTGVNPPALCTGVDADCDSGLENSDATSWVY